MLQEKIPLCLEAFARSCPTLVHGDMVVVQFSLDICMLIFEFSISYTLYV
jgi:hypothetical protein